MIEPLKHTFGCLETPKISGMATGYKVKEVVGVTTSEVSKNDTWTSVFCMVAMKFTSPGTRNVSDSGLWYGSHIKVLTTVPQKELLFTNITRNRYTICRFPSSKWHFKDGVQTHKVFFIESCKFNGYYLNFIVCRIPLYTTLSPRPPVRIAPNL